jgi:hypothetical protein
MMFMLLDLIAQPMGSPEKTSTILRKMKIVPSKGALVWRVTTIRHTLILVGPLLVRGRDVRCHIELGRTMV